MIYVTIDGTETLDWLAFRRLEASYGARRARHYYTSPQYPGLLVQTQGPDFTAAELGVMAGERALVALYSGPEENDAARWRLTLPELNDAPDIVAKISLFRPRESYIPETRPLAQYLAERHAEAQQELARARSQAARRLGLED